MLLPCLPLLFFQLLKFVVLSFQVLTLLQSFLELISFIDDSNAPLYQPLLPPLSSLIALAFLVSSLRPFSPFRGIRVVDVTFECVD